MYNYLFKFVFVTYLFRITYGSNLLIQCEKGECNGINCGFVNENECFPYYAAIKFNVSNYYKFRCQMPEVAILYTYLDNKCTQQIDIDFKNTSVCYNYINHTSMFNCSNSISKPMVTQTIYPSTSTKNEYKIFILIIFQLIFILFVII